MLMAAWWLVDCESPVSDPHHLRRTPPLSQSSKTFGATLTHPQQLHQHSHHAFFQHCSTWWYVRPFNSLIDMQLIACR